MASVLNQGRLKTWKDDRGFGFIKPDDGGKDVFLHISALKGAGRRPKVGDRILYQLVVQPNGKVSAAQASIQGVRPRLFSTKGKRRKQGLFKTVLETVLGFGFLIAFAIKLGPSVFRPILKPECNIKGNISYNTGNKIYHLPGMEYYQSTRIDPTKGERWFCSESEAIANGWRKARR